MASAGNAYGSDDFKQRPFIAEGEVAAGVVAETILGPWKLPTFNGQSAEMVTVWVTSDGTFATTFALEQAPTENGPWGLVGNEQALTDEATVQGVYVGGDYVRIVMTPTSNAAGINLAIQAKTRG